LGGGQRDGRGTQHQWQNTGSLILHALLAFAFAFAFAFLFGQNNNKKTKIKKKKKNSQA
jgi:hypothetical protein